MQSSAKLFAVLSCSAAFAVALPGGNAWAAEDAKPVNLDVSTSMDSIDIIEHLGDKLPLHLRFHDSDGSEVALSDLIDGTLPVILTLNYYECPMLCTFELNGMVKGLQALDFEPGKSYRIVTVSIDPDETPKLATAKGGHYRNSLGRGTAADWRFLVGDKESLAELTGAVGFKYFYDRRRDEWAHAACIFILTPDGRLSRYLYGIEFPSKDLRLALVEASEGTIGTAMDKFLLFCFHYDPQGKRYSLAAINIMRAGGVLTVLLLGSTLAVYWRRERGKKLLNKPQSDAAAA